MAVSARAAQWARPEPLLTRGHSRWERSLLFRFFASKPFLSPAASEKGLPVFCAKHSAVSNQPRRSPQRARRTLRRTGPYRGSKTQNLTADNTVNADLR